MLFYIMKNSQSVAKFQMDTMNDPPGEIIVDYNSGLININFMNDEGENVKDSININSLLDQTWDPTKSEVKIKYRYMPEGKDVSEDKD